MVCKYTLKSRPANQKRERETVCVDTGRPVDVFLSFSVPIAVFLFSSLPSLSFLLFPSSPRLPLPLPTPVLHAHLRSPSHPPHITPTLLLPLSAFHLPPTTPQMIDGEAFLLLTQADIVKIMSVKLGPALKIYNAILMFKNADDTLK